MISFYIFNSHCEKGKGRSALTDLRRSFAAMGHRFRPDDSCVTLHLYPHFMLSPRQISRVNNTPAFPYFSFHLSDVFVKTKRGEITCQNSFPKREIFKGNIVPRGEINPSTGEPQAGIR